VIRPWCGRGESRSVYAVLIKHTGSLYLFGENL
jgi:hypothetical protein